MTDHSDTEVILRGFEEWGRAVVDHLTGMFAFAISDHERGELFLARDRLGIKPLYYIESPNFVFGSELKAIFQDARCRAARTSTPLRRFILFRVHDEGEDTFFDGVKRLLPGHTMLVRPDGIVKIEKYWNPAGESRVRVGAQRRRVRGGVRRGMGPRRRAPPHLRRAGGRAAVGRSRLERRRLDDGAPHARAAPTCTPRVCTPSRRCIPGRRIDESEYIHEVERAVGSIPHYAYPQPTTFWNEIDEWIWYQEEPTIASAPYAYYSVYRLASEHVKVMVSGNGGDELLAGYIPYFRAYLSSAIAQHHYLAGAREIVKGWDLYKKYFAEVAKARAPRSARATPSPRANCSRRAGGRRAKLRRTQEPQRAPRERRAPVLDARSVALRRQELDGVLDRGPRAVPRPRDGRVHLRAAHRPEDQGRMEPRRLSQRDEGRMPEKNRLRRSKIGFTNPDITWMKGRADELRAVFASPELAAATSTTRPQLVTAWDEYLAGRPGDGLIFWRVLVTELWMRRYIDRAVAA